MGEEKNRYTNLFKKYMTKMSSLFSSRAGADVYDQIKLGKTSYMRYERTESSSFDMNWIKEIEDIIFDLNEIVKNPKRNTRIEETVLPAELARKTNATSVRHLASHTQYIKELDEKGNVTPSKILNIGYEDETNTYENRFVATLIRKLILFIEKRYEYINEYAELKDVEVMMIKNKSYIDGKEVEIETKIKIQSDNDVTGTGSNSVYIGRIKEIRKYIRFYYNSDFMKMFKNERDVRNPILMTNIIRKNPLYHHCYELYKFIENYDTLGVNFKINERFSDFTDKEMEEINATLMANFLQCKGKDPEKGFLKNTTKQYKPKILASIDDEELTYSSKLLKGPIEYVRVDDEYLAYLQTKHEEVPDRPKKEEKEYYKEEIKEDEEKKKLEKANKALLARRKKEQKVWDKQAEKLVAKRQKEEREAQLRAEKLAREREAAIIAQAREELKQEAKSDTSNMKVEEVKEAQVDEFEALKALQEQAQEDAKSLEEELVSDVEQNNEESVPEMEQIVEEPQEEQEINEEEPVEEATEEVVEEEPNEEPIESPEETSEAEEASEEDKQKELEEALKSLSAQAEEDVQSEEPLPEAEEEKQEAVEENTSEEEKVD